MSRYYVGTKVWTYSIWKYPEAQSLSLINLNTYSSLLPEPALLSTDYSRVPDTLILLRYRSFLDA